MKRFLLFAGPNYYPSGGWEDFIGAFDTQQEAQAEYDTRSKKKSSDYHWYQIVDLTMLKECEVRQP